MAITVELTNCDEICMKPIQVYNSSKDCLGLWALFKVKKSQFTETPYNSELVCSPFFYALVVKMIYWGHP